MIVTKAESKGVKSDRQCCAVMSDPRPRLRLLLVCYYDLRDGLIIAANELERLQVNMCGTFGIFNYHWSPKMAVASSTPVERSTLESHKGAKKEATNDSEGVIALQKKIAETQPDVVLFWCFSLPLCDLKLIRQRFPTPCFALFNWDDPHVWTGDGSDMQGKAACFDVAFSSCEECIEWYEKAGTGRAHFLLPGAEISSPTETTPLTATPVRPVAVKENQNSPLAKHEKTFQYDISACVTNLYEDESIYAFQRLSRRKRMDLIYEQSKAKGWRFGLFGPKFLKKIYPDAYVAEVSYLNGPAVFASSRLNLSTHVDCRYRYCNERDIRVTAAGGLLLTDTIPNFPFTHDQESVVLSDDPTHMVQQLDQLLDPTSNAHLDHIAKQGQALTRQSFTWQAWATALVSALHQSPRTWRSYFLNRVTI